MLSDFKSRGFRREDTRLAFLKRLNALILVVDRVLCRYVRTGKDNARSNPPSAKA